MKKETFIYVIDMISQSTGVTLKENKEGSWAANVEDKVITYPEDSMSEANLGFLIHEASHLRYTKPGEKTNEIIEKVKQEGLDTQEYFRLVNALEDIRIHRLIVNHFPGAEEYLKEVHHKTLIEISNMMKKYKLLNDKKYEEYQNDFIGQFGLACPFLLPIPVSNFMNLGMKPGDLEFRMDITDLVYGLQGKLLEVTNCADFDEFSQQLYEKILPYLKDRLKKGEQEEQQQENQQQQESQQEQQEEQEESQQENNSQNSQQNESKQTENDKDQSQSKEEEQEQQEEQESNEQQQQEEQQQEEQEEAPTMVQKIIQAQETTQAQEKQSNKGDQKLSSLLEQFGGIGADLENVPDFNLLEAEEKEIDQEKVEELKEFTKANISKTRKAISILKDKSFNRWQGGQQKGKLDKHRLHKVMTGSDKVFKRKIEQNKDDTDFCFIVLIDESGSMYKGKADEASMAATLFAKTLEKADKPYAIYGFNRAIFCHKDWNKTMRYEEMSKIVKNSCDLGYADYNNDGWAVKCMIKELKKRKERNKILIVFSDGHPAESPDKTSEGYDCLDYDLEKEVEEAEKEADVYSFGIRDEAVKDFYSKYKILKNPSELSQEMIKLFKEKTGKRK